MGSNPIMSTNYLNILKQSTLLNNKVDMVSYIFTYRQTSIDRFNNLKNVLTWLTNLNVPDLEIMIIEQDDYQKLNVPIDFKIKHIFVKNPGLFNRSWGFNIGVRNTTNPILFFGDSDMIVNPIHIFETINLLQTSQFDVVSPFKQCIELDEKETQIVDIKNFNYSLDKLPRGGMNFCSGIVAYNRIALERIYAWDERFEGWGGEDDIQFMKTRQILKFLTLNASCFHLYHERSKLDGTNQHPNYQNNLSMFWHYHHNVHQILIDMKNNIDWGNLNKYAL